jgi:predicted dehydrogenase/nucleoside-diphosphate-sugar epimerase
MEPSPSGKLRIAIVGAGYVARHHIAALRRLDFVEIVAICDLDLAAARALAAASGIGFSATRLAEVAATRPQLVYVLTPPASHAPIALEAMDLGCHVFVEKPMAETVAECDAMIAKARERGVALSVNHSDRFDPVVLEALRIARSGRIGELVSVDVLRGSEYPPYGGGPLPAPVRQGSYPFRDLGVHAIYTLEAFLGPVARLQVEFQGSGRDPNLRFDEWRAQADCESGGGRALLSWNARPMENRIVVRGTRGLIEADRFLQICRVHRVLPGPKFIGILVEAWRNALLDVFRVPWSVLRFATGMLKPSPGIQASAAAFARAVHGGNQPPVPPEEGRRTVALLEPACAPADAQRTTELEARFVPMAPVDALVTGAAGFLGRALVAALRARGQSVRVLLRRPDARLAGDAEIQVVCGDLGEPAIVDHAVAGARVVYHVGAAMRGGPRAFEAGTVWGTRNVVESCHRHGVQRLVYVSSMSVYDHAGRDPALPMDENSALEPHPQLRGAYTQTKLAAEELVFDAIRSQGLQAVVIRPGQIFGPGAERTTPNGVVGIAGRWFAIGDGEMSLPLVYRDDVVDALLRAADAPEAIGGVFNVVDVEPCTRTEYLRRAKRHLGADLRLVPMPQQLFMALAWGVEQLGRLLKREVPLTRYRVRSLRPLGNFDQTAARTRLGWQPRVGLRRGLDTTFGHAPD